MSTHQRQMVAKDLLIKDLKPGRYQPRQYFDQASLTELAESIKLDGVLEPLIVRPSEKEHCYEIIAGERRWRAAQIAGLVIIPCRISNFSDEDASRIALVENINRQNLNPIEEARGINRYIEEFQYTHEAASSKLGKSRVEITNLLRLLRLDLRVQDLIVTGDLTEAHGKILAGIPLEQQHHYARLSIEKNWSSRLLDRELKNKSLTNNSKTLLSNKNADVRRLEQNLSDHLGYPVNVTYDANGRCKLNIEFRSLEQLDGFLEKVGYHEDVL